MMRLQEYNEATLNVIVVGSVAFNMTPINLTDFMALVEERFSELPDAHWLRVNNGCGLSVQLCRYETESEWSERVEKARDAKRRVQKSADSSWERQKRKFARSRK